VIARSKPHADDILQSPFPVKQTTIVVYQLTR
jgi:hypothetical protein